MAFALSAIVQVDLFVGFAVPPTVGFSTVVVRLTGHSSRSRRGRNLSQTRCARKTDGGKRLTTD